MARREADRTELEEKRRKRGTLKPETLVIVIWDLNDFILENEEV